MSATFPGPPLLRGSSDVVRTRIAKAYIARQNIASAVAVFERVILAVPIHTTPALIDHRAPGSLGALRVSWTETYRCKSGGSHQNRAYHRFQPTMQGFVVEVRVAFCVKSMRISPLRAFIFASGALHRARSWTALVDPRGFRKSSLWRLLGPPQIFPPGGKPTEEIKRPASDGPLTGQGQSSCDAAHDCSRVYHTRRSAEVGPWANSF
jgi:hypothetical protein